MRTAQIGPDLRLLNGGIKGKRKIRAKGERKLVLKLGTNKRNGKEKKRGKTRKAKIMAAAVQKDYIPSILCFLLYFVLR